MLVSDVLSTLVARHPRLFSAGRPGCSEVLEGWLHIADQACAEVEALLPPDAAVFVGQVKEKWGALVVYASAASDFDARMQTILQALEARSETVCCACGAPGLLREIGWRRTLCDEHESEYLQSIGAAT